jgi:hypothetical protein
VECANGEAADYVRNFNWDAADTKHHGLAPYFNLTLDDHYRRHGLLAGRLASATRGEQNDNTQ